MIWWFGALTTSARLVKIVGVEEMENARRCGLGAAELRRDFGLRADDLDAVTAVLGAGRALGDGGVAGVRDGSVAGVRDGLRDPA